MFLTVALVNSVGFDKKFQRLIQQLVGDLLVLG
jgi:hypothetical protein